MSRLRRWGLNLLALSIGLLLCELILLVVARLSPAVAYRLSPHEVWTSIRGVKMMQPREFVPDPVLGGRFSPHAPGHDDWGYRNARVPERCDVLAIGDSMTYGIAVGPEDAWPHVLGRRSGLSVYNAGIGGYGPVEYQVVLEETLRLRPRIVVIGLFLGNDVWEAFRTVYLEGRGVQFARFRNQDPEQHAAIVALTDAAVLRATAARLRGEDVLAGTAPVDDRSALRLWLSAHSSVYGLLRESRHALSELWRAAKGDPVQNPYADSFEESAKRPLRLAWDHDARFRTVFLNPAYDLLAVDVGDTRVREGVRITHQILREVRDRLAAERIGLVVAMISSKQMVYAGLIEKLGPRLPDMDRYLESETRLKVEMTSFFERNAIRHVDVLEALRRELASGRAPYHQSEDSHPTATGYKAIADALLPAVREMSSR